MIDSWALLREAADAVLHLLPRPLPGFHTSEQVRALLRWGERLQASPRLLEADAGARIVSLVFTVYVAVLGRDVQPCVRVAREQTGNAANKVADGCADVQQHACGTPTNAATSSHASDDTDTLASRVAFMSSMVDGLEELTAAARTDMVAVCRRSFLQGPLVAARYVCERMPWDELLQDTATVRLCACPAARASSLLTFERCYRNGTHRVPSQLVTDNVRHRSLTCAPTKDSEILSARVQAAEVADLVKRLLAVLFAAAALCMPSLDGTQNLDAFEVTADDAGANGDADDEASPDVTVLITGAMSITHDSQAIAVLCALRANRGNAPLSE